jgi:hypothetical protein
MGLISRGVVGNEKRELLVGCGAGRGRGRGMEDSELSQNNTTSKGGGGGVL